MKELLRPLGTEPLGHGVLDRRPERSRAIQGPLPTLRERDDSRSLVAAGTQPNEVHALEDPDVATEGAPVQVRLRRKLTDGCLPEPRERLELRELGRVDARRRELLAVQL